jgi:hypothetical protein
MKDRKSGGTTVFAASIMWLILFWTMQIVAHVLFKFGSTSASRWLPCFIGGNVVGASSILILMKLYTMMNPHVTMGLALGGGFLCAQAAIALIFRSSVSIPQCVGILAIAIGMTLLATGDRTDTSKGDSKQQVSAQD